MRQAIGVVLVLWGLMDLVVITALPALNVHVEPLRIIIFVVFSLCEMLAGSWLFAIGKEHP